MARTVTPVSPRGEQALARVRAARSAREAAETEYREAMIAAHSVGVTFTAIAASAGIKPQTAREIVQRATTRGR